MLYTYFSNRLENLADQLAEVVREPLAAILEQEIIVVQNNGMARWVSLHLARRLGVCANIRFRLPASFVWDTYRMVLGDVPETPPFDPVLLTWRLMVLLRGLEDEQRFAPLLAYLADSDDWRYYELAYRIADNYDQYLVYRPDWIEDWESGKGEHWQAELWRRLAAGNENHRVHLLRRFLSAMNRHNTAAGLPQRVSLIGIPALAPMYIEVLAKLAETIDVHLFLLNPCREFWGDIVADRDIARINVDADPHELYLEVGNSLLASLGKQGRDFIDLAQTYPASESESYLDPGEDSLLACLQSDIFNLRQRGSEDYPATAVAANERSLQLHACHSAMREVEVLYDQLLALFHTDPDLQPADIVVMTPDIETYGPIIEAVFATAEGDRYIPFSIADRGARADNPIVDAFFELLDLRHSRYDANRVLALLEASALRRRFGIAAEELALIYRWVRETGIRWGVDAASRGELDLPATTGNTWQSGLDRMLLGYALPGANQRLYGEILPYDEIEGGNTRLMGRLQTFSEAVFRLRDDLAGQYPISDWSARLNALLERFLLPEEADEEALQLLRTALQEVSDSAAGFGEAVSLEVVIACLHRRLEAAPAGGGFLGGGVTFCALVPMRSIPFKVICLIGMNSDSYPRPLRQLGFDLMARRFRRGDRSRRADERYLFLEALLSARRCFYISYIGNDIRDNSMIPPSVLVSELMDVVQRGFYPEQETGADLLAQILCRHPLQAFSPRYFSGDSRLFSYSRELCEAAQVAGRGVQQPLAFIPERLPEPDAAWRTVELAQLVRFFANPVRYLLRLRLGIDLDENDELLQTREPFVLDGLESQRLRDNLLELQLAGLKLPEMLSVVRSAGVLPHGQVGECVIERGQEDAARFAGRLARVQAREIRDPLELDIRVSNDLCLRGWLSGVGEQGIVKYRLAKVRAQDYLDLWLHHLALNCLAPAGVTAASHWLGRDRELVLRPVAEPRAALQTLLALYWRGLQQPLCLFPKSALEYALTARNERSKTSPLEAARRCWRGSDFTIGEGDNPYYRLAFRAHEPLNQEFQDLAETVFFPLFEHLEEQE